MTERSDNAGTVCNLQRQGAGLTLLQLTKQIFKLLQQLDIRLAVAHIPGKENDFVDALSRLEVTGDYSLRWDVFELAVRMLNVTPTIDMFAHNLNNRLPLFVAMDGPLPRGAVAVDAFAQDWTVGLPYLLPPVQLLLRVLAKVRDDGARAVIVVPMWPSQPWWTLLQTMQTNTVALGDAENVLLPGPAMTGSNVTLRLPPGVMLMAIVNPSPRTTVSGSGTLSAATNADRPLSG
jgi:hypothetical protein